MMKTLLRSLFFLCAIALFAPLSASAACVMVDNHSSTTWEPDGSMTWIDTITWNCGGTTYLVITVTITTTSGQSWAQGTYRVEPNGTATTIRLVSGSGPVDPRRRPLDDAVDNRGCEGCSLE
jgi:hypothetical protein